MLPSHRMPQAGVPNLSRMQEAINVATKTKRELTLKDRLSRLTLRDVVRLLGPRGEDLMRAGGAYEIQVGENVYLGDDLFRLKLDDAVVTITSMADKPLRLCWNCTKCR